MTRTTTSAYVRNDALNITGLSEDGVDKFLGIPYAEPPVGNLRFAPPVAKKPWTETLDCTQYQSAAIQNNFLVKEDVPKSEDCLYLNIWKPSDAKEGDKLPVFFWIHGGGWCFGSGSEKTYDGTRFAKEGIIVVTINYRLGTLGYLALNTLMEEYGTAGNWSTLDQICALQWVHDNIAKFGGNPDNVTVGGESAGSFNTFALVLSPKAKGLFQKAAMESGAISYVCANHLNLDESIAIGKQIAEHFGADDSKEGLEKLRKADAMELWTLADPNLQDILIGNPYQTYPVYDGSVLPLNNPLKAINEGNFNKDITILMGNNDVEGVLFVHGEISEEKFNNYIKTVFRPDSYQEVIDYYAAQTDRPILQKAMETVGMTVVTLGVVAAEDAFAKQGKQIYVYDFNYTDSHGCPQTHAMEMPYVFGMSTSLSGQPMNDDDKKVRDVVHGYWVNFIKTGNPNGANVPEWPVYVPGEKTIKEIKPYAATIMRPRQEIIDFLSPKYFR
ncbi:MAG TPA: carboxylesterase family protein [Methanocorpusculum sp.]|nr:carboxylesterase family protein [Methanocorpusculum sp.]